MQGISNWPGNDGKMTSYSNFKERLSARSLDLVRGLVQFKKFGFHWYSSD